MSATDLFRAYEILSKQNAALRAACEAARDGFNAMIDGDPDGKSKTIGEILNQLSAALALSKGDAS